MKNIIFLLLGCGVALSAASASFITYEEFGAVGDGKTDDMPAIVAAHAAANKRNLPVRATAGKTYFIGKAAKTAIIQTDVDFGTANFIIDDVDCEKYTTSIFTIAPSRKPVPVTGIGALDTNVKRITAKLPCACLLSLENNTVRHFIRYGANQNNGTAQREMLLVGADGSIDPQTPLTQAFKAVTKALAFPLEAKPLTITGGHFTTIANQCASQYHYHARNINVNRSSVRLIGLRHDVTGELDHGAPYGGFISVSACANVVVSNCVLTAHRTYRTIGSAGRPVSMGSYDLNCGNAINVSFINCRQTTDINDTRYWGLFGSNFCRNLLFDHCSFSRFDAHMGVANATVRHCELGHMGINAIGYGTFLVEDTTVHGHGAFFNLREDYGSNWRGDFIIKNCVFKPRTKWGAQIVGGHHNGQHDFGYPCFMPRRLIVDGLTIDDSRLPEGAGGPYIFGNIKPSDKPGAAPEPFPYTVTEEVVLRNVKVLSGKPIKVSPNPHTFRNTKVTRQ
ncbi:MAG: hypothetical protein MJ249_02665 [Kiritimatiellae bacterium]|nr:hypothetical protein [Kiritimatiellia bacterium]